ncbi:MAG: hypothetical protein OXU74_06530 [Gemmatimonadota bacterium]|nr:hypothetical protein [Gemmatimonadota bacterium]
MSTQEETTITHDLLDRLGVDHDSTARGMLGQRCTVETMRGDDPRIPPAAQRFTVAGRLYRVLRGPTGAVLHGTPVDADE